MYKRICNGTTLTGNNMKIIGNGNILTGDNLEITGNGNILTGDNLEITGNGNILTEDTLEIIGNGNKITHTGKENIKITGNGNNVSTSYPDKIIINGNGNGNVVNGKIVNYVIPTIQTIYKGNTHTGNSGTTITISGNTTYYANNTNVSDVIIRNGNYSGILNIGTGYITTGQSIPFAGASFSENVVSTENNISKEKVIYPIEEHEKKDIKFKDNIDSEDNRCIICWDNVRKCVALPCGHYNYCVKCSRELAQKPIPKCPNCAGILTELKIIY